MVDNVVSLSFLADIQRGKIPAASFYGDMSVSSIFDSFKTGVDASMNYEGFARLSLNSFEAKVRNEIIKRANSMVSYGNISFEAATEFIMILGNVSKLDDMIKIAVAVDVPELANIEILGDISAIVNIPNFDKVAYLASAVNTVINMFKSFSQASSYSKQSLTTNPIDMLSSMLGNFGGGSITRMIDTSATEDKVGHFLSELITGNRIPSVVIACNAMKESPSYVGKVFFGEASTPISLVDMNEIFNRKIASFGNPMNGSGVSAFNFSNLGSLQGSLKLPDVVKKFAFGSSNPSQARLDEVISKATTIMGASITDSIELNRGDNAIPFMIGMSAINSNMDKSPFPSTSFSEGWKLAQSVNSFVSSNQNDLLTVMRTFG